MDTWDKQMLTQCRLRKAVIIHGNTGDVFFDDSAGSPFDAKEGVSIARFVTQRLKAEGGYANIVCWDCNSGTYSFEGDAEEQVQEAFTRLSGMEAAANSGDDASAASQQFEFGAAPPTAAGDRRSLQAGLEKPQAFFRILLDRFRAPVPRDAQGNPRPIAYVIDGAEALFGRQDALSAEERRQLLQLWQAVRDAPCSVSGRALNERGDVLLLITPRLGLVPPRLAQDCAAFGSVLVPKPDHKERARILNCCQEALVVREDIARSPINFDALVDALDGFTSRDICQIVKLSRIQDAPLSMERLVALYRYGEKHSPWEDLSLERLSRLGNDLKARVKGQDHVVDRVVETISCACLGLSGLEHSSRQQKPKGVFFFVGPTGVGKTEMAKAIAQFVFGDETAYLRFDMSEYNHDHCDQRLVGAPPGYVGHESGGLLTNAVREKPFSVLLFDEVEKAHPSILDKFLQILEDGRLTDGQGNTVSFAETVIIFTSNIGNDKITPDMPDAAGKFIEAVEQKFQSINRPEIFNRVGRANVIPFNYLRDPNVLRDIAKAKLRPFIERLREKYGLGFVFNGRDEDGCVGILLGGFDVRYGGRDVGARIQEVVIRPFAAKLIEWIEREGVEALRGRVARAKLACGGKLLAFELDGGES
jgi:hypothetical protein